MGHYPKSEQIKRGKRRMKKIFCMALSAALLAGSVPAYAAEESLFTKTPHTFTARVGTTEFTKDGTAQPLVLYALKDFLIKRLGSLLEHTT